jgi:hypothetical protein
MALLKSFSREEMDNHASANPSGAGIASARHRLNHVPQNPDHRSRRCAMFDCALHKTAEIDHLFASQVLSSREDKVRGILAQEDSPYNHRLIG